MPNKKETKADMIRQAVSLASVVVPNHVNTIGRFLRVNISRNKDIYPLVMLLLTNPDLWCTMGSGITTKDCIIEFTFECKNETKTAALENLFKTNFPDMTRTNGRYVQCFYYIDKNNDSTDESITYQMTLNPQSLPPAKQWADDFCNRLSRMNDKNKRYEFHAVASMYKYADILEDMYQYSMLYEHASIIDNGKGTIKISVDTNMQNREKILTLYDTLVSKHTSSDKYGASYVNKNFHIYTGEDQSVDSYYSNDIEDKIKVVLYLTN